MPALVHELSSLLDAAGRHLGLVMRRCDTPTDPGARLRTIKTALDEMTRLLRTAGALRRPGDVRATALARALTLGEAVRHAADLLVPLAEAHRVTVTARVEPDAERCPCGPAFAVVSNAVRNAIEAAASPGGRAGVRVAIHVNLDAAGIVRVEVGDDGPGLPRDPRTRARLFEPGFSTRGGSGIGLAYARDLIDEYGGRIALTDRADRSGAMLAAEWPARTTARRASAPRQMAVRPRRPRANPTSQD